MVRDKSLVAGHDVGLGISGIVISGDDLAHMITVITQGQVSGLKLYTPTDELQLISKKRLFA